MRLIDADALEKEFFHGCQYEHNKYANCIDCPVANAPTVDAIPLDTKIVVQTYDEEHEEWANEIMTIQELLDSGMCEIYREECTDQYE